MVCELRCLSLKAYTTVNQHKSHVNEKLNDNLQGKDADSIPLMPGSVGLVFHPRSRSWLYPNVAQSWGSRSWEACVREYPPWTCHAWNLGMGPDCPDAGGSLDREGKQGLQKQLTLWAA